MPLAMPNKDTLACALGRARCSPVKSRCLTYFVLTALTSACAVPQIGELRATAPSAQFIVQAPLDCLFDKGCRTCQLLHRYHRAPIHLVLRSKP